MKLLQKPVSLLLAGIALGFLPLSAQAAVFNDPAPGQSVEEWYLRYMQQYSGSPIYQPSLAAKPTPPAVAPPAPQAQPSAPGTPSAPGRQTVPPQPDSSQDPRQWYLDYLQQYQSPTSGNSYGPAVPAPSQPAPPSQSGNKPSAPAPPTIPEPTGLTAEEAQIFQWVNQERIKAGKAPVEVDPELVRLARLKAEDVATYDYFGHTSPTYGTPGQMLTNAGYRWAAAGETIAKAGSVYKAHAMLIASSAHRQIILSEEYTKVGIGVAHYRGRPGLVVVELFVRPYGN